MGINHFSGCERRLTEDDLVAVEKVLQIVLPAAFRRHYLQYNGGTPERTVWADPGGKWDDIEVRDFFAFWYFQEKQDDPDFTINGIAEENWRERQLPTALLPFAIDWGGNYFCIDHVSGEVHYFVRDVWSDKLSPEKNLLANTRPLKTSFERFVSDLIPSEDP